MTQNEFDGMLLKASGVICAGLVGLWGFFKTFATQKDFDQLRAEVEDLRDKQHASDIITTRLETTLKNLDRAVRELIKTIQQQQQHNHNPSCAISYPPHSPFHVKDESE